MAKDKNTMKPSSSTYEGRATRSRVAAGQAPAPPPIFQGAPPKKPAKKPNSNNKKTPGKSKMTRAKRNANVPPILESPDASLAPQRREPSNGSDPVRLDTSANRELNRSTTPTHTAMQGEHSPAIKQSPHTPQIPPADAEEGVDTDSPLRQPSLSLGERSQEQGPPSTQALIAALPGSVRGYCPVTSWRLTPRRVIDEECSPRTHRRLSPGGATHEEYSPRTNRRMSGERHESRVPQLEGNNPSIVVSRPTPVPGGGETQQPRDGSNDRSEGDEPRNGHLTPAHDVSPAVKESPYTPPIPYVVQLDSQGNSPVRQLSEDWPTPPGLTSHRETIPKSSVIERRIRSPHSSPKSLHGIADAEDAARRAARSPTRLYSSASPRRRPLSARPICPTPRSSSSYMKSPARPMAGERRTPEAQTEIESPKSRVKPASVIRPRSDSNPLVSPPSSPTQSTFRGIASHPPVQSLFQLRATSSHPVQGLQGLHPISARRNSQKRRTTPSDDADGSEDGELDAYDSDEQRDVPRENSLPPSDDPDTPAARFNGLPPSDEPDVVPYLRHNIQELYGQVEEPNDVISPQEKRVHPSKRFIRFPSPASGDPSPRARNVHPPNDATAKSSSVTSEKRGFIPKIPSPQNPDHLTSMQYLLSISEYTEGARVKLRQEEAEAQKELESVVFDVALLETLAAKEGIATRDLVDWAKGICGEEFVNAIVSAAEEGLEDGDYLFYPFLRDSDDDEGQKNGAENAEQTAPVDVTDLENRTRANRGPDERACDGETDAGSDDSEPQETASPTGPDCPSISHTRKRSRDDFESASVPLNGTGSTVSLHAEAHDDEDNNEGSHESDDIADEGIVSAALFSDSGNGHPSTKRVMKKLKSWHFGDQDEQKDHDLSGEAPESTATLVEPHLRNVNINAPPALRNTSPGASYIHPYHRRQGPAPSASRPTSPSGVQEDYEIEYSFHLGVQSLEGRETDRSSPAGSTVEDGPSPKRARSRSMEWRVVG